MWNFEPKRWFEVCDHTGTAGHHRAVYTGYPCPVYSPPCIVQASRPEVRCRSPPQGRAGREGRGGIGGQSRSGETGRMAAEVCLGMGLPVELWAVAQ